MTKSLIRLIHGITAILRSCQAWRISSTNLSWRYSADKLCALRKVSPKEQHQRESMATGDETSARGPRRGWEMGLLCHRKYREAVRLEIRAYFSFCPAITAAPRIHGRAVTNIGAVARMTVEETEGTVERTKKGRREGRFRVKRSERVDKHGGLRVGRDPISYSSSIPPDLPAFLLYLSPVRICFIYISYFSLSFFLFLCPSLFLSVSRFVVRNGRGTLSWIRTGWPRNMKSRYGIPRDLRRRNSSYILCSP